MGKNAVQEVLTPAHPISMGSMAGETGPSQYPTFPATASPAIRGSYTRPITFPVLQLRFVRMVITATMWTAATWLRGDVIRVGADPSGTSVELKRLHAIGLCSQVLQHDICRFKIS